MHVDWRWIKQRPHFIAEGLSEFYDVTVVHFCSKRYLFGGFDGSNHNDKNLNLLPAFRLPFYQKEFIYKLNRIYMKFYFNILIKRYNPDFIWVTFPQLYDYIPSDINCKIIYDCMDLATGFDFPDNFKSKIHDLEKKLVEDASLVFTSSNYLFNQLNREYGCENKLFLVRNAFGGEIIDVVERKEENKKTFKIGYVGTISKWIDFKNIKMTLDKLGNIEYHFIGPSELECDFKEDRIKFYGTITHSDLYDYVQEFDCLIVPFKLNELVKSVDPVKLYEYINYNKSIISIYYDELDYFSQFICFYSDTQELINLLKQMIKNQFVMKYSDDERAKFLEKNSWDVRVSEITKHLAKL